MTAAPSHELGPGAPHLGDEEREAATFFDRLMNGPLRLGDAEGPDAPGHVGPWALRARIGRGGMSTVYHAVRDTPRGPQEAALKLAKRAGGEIDALFEHEARILRQLGPPRVVGLLDAGRHADGRPFLAMEAAAGTRVTTQARGESDWGRLLLLWRVCRCVAGLHADRVVHGDLKPEHVVVRPDGTITLLDLGLALDLTTAETPQPARLGVTPEFAAPEQILREPVSCATDVYALGLVMHEVLTGERRIPWSLSGDAGLALDGLAAPLADVLQTALQTDPAERYPDADALAAALDGVLDAFAS